MHHRTVTRFALRHLSVAAALALGAAASQAAIVYSVDRTIGAATLTGYIETDGTLGSITAANFTDYSLTLLAPDINGGAASTINFGFQSFFTDGASLLSATATDLLFDHEGASGLFFAYTSSGDFWCLAGGGTGDTGCFAQGEIVGYSDTTSGSAYIAARSGMTAFGTTAASVPVPTTLSLAVAALGLMALRGRKAQAAA